MSQVPEEAKALDASEIVTSSVASECIVFMMNVPYVKNVEEEN